jgi:hypothetical protein
MSVPTSEKAAHAYISGDELVIEDFREQDADVVDFVRAAEDVEAAVHHCLAMGARVLRVAGVTLDSQLVEHRFEEMTSDLNRKIEDFAERVDESAESLLDDEKGKLTIALRSWLEEVGTLLGDTFDETSKKSAIAKLEGVLEAARKEQTRAVKQLLNPHDDESPLGRWRAQIVETVKERSDKIEEAVQNLATQMQVKGAVAEEHGQTALKGFDFEDVVLSVLTSIAIAHQDVPAHVGNETGSDGTKKGDIIVTLNPSDSPIGVLRYVVEAKDRRMTLKGALDELDEAMRNRDATAGFMVFAGQALSPVDEPFQCFHDKALIVLDKDELDPCALRLGSTWARWTVRREEMETSEEVDIGRIQALIESARRSLKTARSVKGDHTRARTAIDQAGRHVDDLVAELEATLDELEEVVATVGCDQG